MSLTQFLNPPAETSSATLQNKVYDGGIASDNSVLILAQNNTAGLAAMTSKKAMLVYNNQTNEIMVDKGSGFVNVSGGGGGGMDWSTPVDANIVPISDVNFDLGSASNRFANSYLYNLRANGILGYTGQDVSLQALGDGSGLTGNVVLSVGGPATQGKIKFQDGSQGTTGYVWTSVGTGGEGTWMAPSGGSNNPDNPGASMTVGATATRVYIGTNSGISQSGIAIRDASNTIDVIANPTSNANSTVNLWAAKTILFGDFDETTVAPQLQFMDVGANNYFAFKSPTAYSQTTTATLPLNGGTNGQVLTTSGGTTPTLSWTTPSGGSFNPASINSDLLPDTDDTRVLGSTSKRWAAGHIHILKNPNGSNFINSANNSFSDQTGTVLIDLNNVRLQNETGDNKVTWNGNNLALAAPNNGVITLHVGLSGTGAMRFQHPSSGASVGKAWVSSTTLGEGSWSNRMTIESGTTGARPGSPLQGQMYLDTTLGKPIWRNGSNWIDATGATV